MFQYEESEEEKPEGGGEEAGGKAARPKGHADFVATGAGDEEPANTAIRYVDGGGLAINRSGPTGEPGIGDDEESSAGGFDGPREGVVGGFLRDDGPGRHRFRGGDAFDDGMAGGIEAGGIEKDGFGGGEIGGGEELVGEAKTGEDGGIFKDGDAVGGEGDFAVEAGSAGGEGAGGGAGEDVADAEGREDLALGEEGFAANAAEVEAGKGLVTLHPHGGVVVGNAEAVHHIEEGVGLEEGEVEG